MSDLLWRATLPGVALVLLSSPLAAHEIVGNRIFPATLGIDDPGVSDELTLPTITSFKTGDTPPAREHDFSAEYSKRITDAFAISVGSTYTHLRPFGGPDLRGFQNLETTFKYRLYSNPEHEFVISVGLGIEWGGTGAGSVGAEPFNVYTPTLFFGKGFGDLPEAAGWLRAFAITGQIGYAMPGRRATTTFGLDDSGMPLSDTEINPDVLVWGGTLQYSLPYLKSAVIDLGLPDFINRFIPIVEATLTTPIAHTATSGSVTTGTINPGLLWIGNGFQVGAEALIPVNRQSGSGVGVIGQLHFYLDDIDPQGIGRPIFGNAVQPARAFRRN